MYYLFFFMLISNKIRRLCGFKNYKANTAFCSKQRFLTSKMYKDLKTILTKMYADTKYKATLCDDRILINKVPKEEQMHRQSRIKLGKIELTIENKSGEIVSNNKPFYESWLKVMKKLGEALTMFKEHYNDENYITKSVLGIKGFTEKEFEKLSQYQ